MWTMATTVTTSRARSQIDFKQPLMLSVHWFEVEPSPTWFDVEYLRILGIEVEPTCGYDSLTVDEIKYCGTSVPDG